MLITDAEYAGETDAQRDRSANLPEYASLDDWARAGKSLGSSERTVTWRIADWWIAGENFGKGERLRTVMHPSWDGPDFNVCKSPTRIS
jgi:hypothetical protein